jgi:hypothetical protein
MSDRWPNSSEREREQPGGRTHRERGESSPLEPHPESNAGTSAETSCLPLREPLSIPAWDEAEQTLPARSAEGVGLGVALWRDRDRYAHALYAFDGSADPPLLLMASVEGNDREPWPASPPLQQLIVEPRESGRNVALLIGMAGSSHWSLSIDVDSGARLIVFEAACRCSTRPVEMGSRYRVRPGSRLAQQDLQWHLPHSGQVQLVWPDSRGQCQEGNSNQMDWIVRPAAMSPTRWPATVRWNYAARCLS